MFKLCHTCSHRCQLPKLFGGYQTGVEVGVLHGNYANALLGRWPGLLHLVDPWKGYPEYSFGGLISRERTGIQDYEHNYRWTRAVLLSYPPERYRIWRERNSDDLANRIGMVDFAYVDANHALEYVTADLHIWWEHLNPGGLLAGHDLFQIEHPGVTEAVVLFAHEHRRDVFIIPGKDGCPCGDGGVPSWYIYKDGSGPG